MCRSMWVLRKTQALRQSQAISKLNERLLLCVSHTQTDKVAIPGNNSTDSLPALTALSTSTDESDENAMVCDAIDE